MSDTATFSEPLADEDARREFAGELNGNFNVCAGAGVGKTRAIVERIASLAKRRREEPDILSRLVVVTYGKLAAEELRVRTRDLLLARTERSAHGRQRLLSDLRGVFFGTIHSFCLKLIADHGRHLGLPAQPVLLEDRDEPELWARFTDGDALASLKLPPAELAAVTRHLTFDELLTLARRLDPGEVGSGKAEGGIGNEENLAGVSPSETPPSAFRLPPSAFEAALADSGGKHPKARLTTLRHQETLRRWLADFADPAGRPFLALPEFKGGSGTFLEAANGAFVPLARWVDAVAGRLAGAIARAWRDFRLERGVMTYRDMVFWCRRLLDDPAVLRRVRERGLIVILDEAQDTDGEMFAILSEITRPLDATPFAWPDDPDAPGPLPGRFSFVGDEQQAIYRHRADPAVFRRYVDAYREGRGGRRLEFSVTMRCPRRVIDAVNGLFGDNRLPQADCEFRALAPRPECPGGGVWRLDLPASAPLADDGGKSNQGDRIGAECAAVADFLAQREPSGLGATRWSEVAILAPRIDWLEAAARALGARGIPVSLLSQKRPARERPAHAWPAALLHVLVNPWDRWELIGVLREVFAVSDVDLARWHRGAKEGLAFWPKPDPERVRAATTPGAKRLAEALTLLRELRAAMPGETGAKVVPTLGRYVAFVLDRSHLADRLHAVGADGEALPRLRQLALQAECDGLALRPWVRRLVEDLELPPPPAAEGPDAVQLLTSHKAKGLEWPVVIPLGLGCKLQPRSEGFPRVERDAGPPATFTVHFTKRTVDEVRAAREEVRRQEEFQRLLYVTLTRARRLLVIPDGAALHGKKAPNLLGLANWDGLDGNVRRDLFPDAPLRVETPPAASDTSTTASPPVPSAAPVVEFRDHAKRLARARAASVAIPKRTLPSSLVHDAVDTARMTQAETTALGDDDAPEAVGNFVGTVGGVDYGDWWHRTVEGYPWRGTDDARAGHLRAACARLAETDPAGAGRAAAETARFTASEFHADVLRAGGAFLPEAPFSHPKTAEEWVEGIMDLVVVTGEGTVWVVDWKTDRSRRGEPPDAQLARLAEKYGPQLRAYAGVFEQGLGRAVAARLLYSTPLGQAVEVADNVGREREALLWTDESGAGGFRATVP